MSAFSEIEGYLRSVAPPKSGLRPFVCDGSPLDCDVALVGYNPATILDADFWDFWLPEIGFDKARWFETYKAERISRPLKPGKKRRNAVSPTRKRIELFVGGLGNHRCIETNLYWDASEDIASHRHSTQPHIHSMLKYLSALKLVVCHHESAFKFLTKHLPSVRIELVDHFANRKPGWSDDAASRLGHRMCALLDELD
jgi:hypothetical protein